MLALVVGLLIGLGAAFLVDYLDNSLRDEGDLAKSTRLPVLAVIPKLKDWKPTDVHVITREQPSSPPGRGLPLVADRGAVPRRRARDAGHPDHQPAGG